MEILNCLPIIKDLWHECRYKEALDIISKSPETVALHLLEELSNKDNIVDSDDNMLVLAKLYMLQGQDERCLWYLSRIVNRMNDLDVFYRESMLFRMMDFLRIHRTHSEIKIDNIRNYVLQVCVSTELENNNYIGNNELSNHNTINTTFTSIDLVGFLCEIGEFEHAKREIHRLLDNKIDCADLIGLLSGYFRDNMQSIVLDVPYSRELLHYRIDAYVAADRISDLQSFLADLPWDELYDACFYIEDTHALKFDLTNQNAALILSGELKQEIFANFMVRNSLTSFQFIESMNKARCPLISLCNCLMNAGTTNDTLYRNNKGLLDEKEWIRFLEYSAIGLVHSGNTNPFEILKELLPSHEHSNGEPSALMVLGMMSVGSGDKEIIDYLLNWLDVSNNELIFGACMGLGLCLLGMEDIVVTGRIRRLLATDNTIVQEAAVYSIGLIYAGTGNLKIYEELKILHEQTDFLRLRRVCGIALALINACSEPPFSNLFVSSTSTKIKNSSDSDTKNSVHPQNLFDSLNSSDASTREYALLSLGTAYVATANLGIIRHILPFINDGDDDVKRAAVVAIAFVAGEDPQIMETCLVPLAQNYNSYVRATVAVVLGLFTCGTGNELVCNLLEALLYDSVDLVRHSACIGIGLALQQANSAVVKNYKRILDKVNLFVVSKSDSQCVKIGASIGRALAEMGGRCAIFSLGNLSRRIELKRVIGAFMFIQSWYWYPLISCISLCILPTPIFFLDENLNEIEESIPNSLQFYDHLVKLPEIKRTRRYKMSKDSLKDTIVEAPSQLSSGMRLIDMARDLYGIDCPIFFGTAKLSKFLDKK